MTKREKIQGIIIAVLSAIIVFGGAFFASELRFCEVKETSIEFEEINMVDFTTLLNANEKSFVYIARPGCHYCQEQKPILTQVASEHNLKVFYLNTDNLSETDFNSLIALDKESFGEDGSKFGTPTMMIVKGGKAEATIVGLTEHDALEEFIHNNGMVD